MSKFPGSSERFINRPTRSKFSSHGRFILSTTEPVMFFYQKKKNCITTRRHIFTAYKSKFRSPNMLRIIVTEEPSIIDFFLPLICDFLRLYDSRLLQRYNSQRYKYSFLQSKHLDNDFLKTVH